MRNFRVITASACLAGAMASTGASGAVAVSFVEPGLFTDAGWSWSVRDRNLKVLADFLSRLGDERLAADQTLKLDVLDVDLAGVQKVNSTPTELRIANGGADWPRIRLRYSLEQGGRVVKSGEARIADLDYLRNSDVDMTREPLRYEKRMLRRWFDTEIAPSRSVGAAAR